MTLALLGIHILIIMALWHFMVKKTLLDNTRDRLFDLRNEIRLVHLERDWNIGSDVYGNLRGMINAYLRYTESYSVWTVVAVHAELSHSQNTGLRDHLAARIDSNFKTDSTELQEYIASVRDRAGNALMEYSVYSSGLLLLAAVTMTPYFMAIMVLDHCRKGVFALGAVVRDALHPGRVFKFVWSLSTGWVASKVIDHQSIDVAISNDSHRFACSMGAA